MKKTDAQALAVAGIGLPLIVAAYLLPTRVAGIWFVKRGSSYVPLTRAGGLLASQSFVTGSLKTIGITTYQWDGSAFLPPIS